MPTEEDPAAHTPELITNSEQAQLLRAAGGYMTNLVESFGKQMKETEEIKLAIKKLEVEDRPKKRLHELSVKKSDNWLYGTVFGMILLLAGFALSLGKESFALEVIRYFLTTGIGALGGYGVAAAKHSKQAKPEDD